MGFVPFPEEELREIGAVLAGDSRDEGYFFHVASEKTKS
jgi:hypothetical protein